MDYMLIFSNERGAQSDPSVYEKMGHYVVELTRQGKIKSHAPLRPEREGARIRLSERKPVVSDGPFTETKEVIGGYFIIQAADRQEAIAIAGRAPHLEGGFVEVRELIDVSGRG